MLLYVFKHNILLLPIFHVIKNTEDFTKVLHTDKNRDVINYGIDENPSSYYPYVLLSYISDESATFRDISYK